MPKKVKSKKESKIRAISRRKMDIDGCLPPEARVEEIEVIIYDNSDFFEESSEDEPSRHFMISKIIDEQMKIEIEDQDVSQQSVPVRDYVKIDEIREKRKKRIAKEKTENKCKICAKAIKGGRSKLLRHMSIHTKQGDFSCKICDKKFSQKDYLNRHLELHEETNYKCNICCKSFTRKDGLNRHLQIHAGLQKFECKQCKKKFNDSGNLSKHMNIHNGIKPYQCKICKVKFTVKSSLNTHERTHNGARPFKCPFCDLAFSASHTRKKHINRKHIKKK